MKQKIIPIVSNFKHADSFGFDFHKTGYCPYNSSFFLVKNKKDLNHYIKDSKKIAPLFHTKKSLRSTGYLYTMETTRSSANMISTWLGLKSLGIEGLQLLIGNGLENSFLLLDLMRSKEASDAGLMVINSDFFGTTVNLRLFNGDPRNEHKKELKNRKYLESNNSLTNNFFYFLKNTKKYSDKISVSCSRASFYLSPVKQGRGIRICFLNPYTNKDHVRLLYKLILKAAYEFKDKKSNK